MCRVRQRVRQCEFCSVRHPEETDAIDAERLPDGLEILGVVVRAVVVPVGAERLRATRDLGLLGIGCDRALQRRAAQDAGAARTAVVVRDERVPREEERLKAALSGLPRSKAPADPWPGPPAIRNITPLDGPTVGSVSTCSEIVPGLDPVRSSGTSICVQTSPGVVPQVAAAAFVHADVWKTGDTPVPGKRRARRGAIPALLGLARRRAERRSCAPIQAPEYRRLPRRCPECSRRCRRPARRQREG